jgi:hypothetical protein
VRRCALITNAGKGLFGFGFGFGPLFGAVFGCFLGASRVL